MKVSYLTNFPTHRSAKMVFLIYRSLKDTENNRCVHTFLYEFGTDYIYIAINVPITYSKKCVNFFTTSVFVLSSFYQKLFSQKLPKIQGSM